MRRRAAQIAPLQLLLLGLTMLLLAGGSAALIYEEIRVRASLLPYIPAVVLVLGLFLLAWAAYSVWQRERVWRTLLADKDLGIILCDEQGRESFSNESARKLRTVLTPDEFARLARNVKQEDRVLREREGILIEAVSRALGADQGRLILLRNVTQARQREIYYRGLIREVLHEMAHYHGFLGDQDLRDYMHIEIKDALNRGERRLRLTRASLIEAAEYAIGFYLEKAREKNMKINRSFERETEREIEIDFDAWKRVFLNLISNCIKHGQEDGIIDVSVDQYEPDSWTILIQNYPAGGQPLSNPQPGNLPSDRGLGLLIAKNIVVQHNATFESEFAPGQGTVRIVLPIRQG